MERGKLENGGWERWILKGLAKNQQFIKLKNLPIIPIRRFQLYFILNVCFVQSYGCCESSRQKPTPSAKPETRNP